VAEDDQLLRVDETWFRLREWTRGQADSERLAAQVLDDAGFKDIDPSHPLGGQDGGRDGHRTRDGEPWTWAVYFPRGQHDLKDIQAKLTSDIDAARKHNPKGVAFVTNQELRLAERRDLRSLGDDIEIDLYHLERVAGILDRPRMHPVREQYLQISAGPQPILIKAEVLGVARRFIGDGDLMAFIGDLNDDREREHEREIRERDKEERQRQRARKAREARERAAREGGLGFPNSLLASSMLPNTIDWPTLQMAGLYGTQPDEPRPRSDEELEADLQRFRDELAGRWDRCTDYLASVAWPALHFRITNERYLKNVEIILTFHQARGAEFIESTEFRWMKFEDPSCEPYGNRVVMPAMPPRSREVHWRNKGDDLIVTINLPELRPYPPRELEGNDIVLRVLNTELDAVDVTWTATAEGYNGYFEGPPITVPVETINAIDATKAVIEASKAGEDQTNAH
jgi:hypothetical protein